MTLNFGIYKNYLADCKYINFDVIGYNSFGKIHRFFSSHTVAQVTNFAVREVKFNKGSSFEQTW